jgi:hypothetical protein
VLIEPQTAQPILVFCVASASALSPFAVSAHTCGRDVKAVRIHFDLRMRARDCLCDFMPEKLPIESVEDSDSITNTDARRWLCGSDGGASLPCGVIELFLHN